MVHVMAAPTTMLLILFSSWVSLLSGLPPAPVPQVTLTNLAKPEGYKPVKLTHDDDGDECSAAAITTPGHVWINAKWKPDNIEDLCTLVHEMTHVAQFHAGIKYRYVEDSEAQAYAVQKMCVEAFGGHWNYPDEQLKRETTHDPKRTQKCDRKP
jgi:hypothetical protein